MEKLGINGGFLLAQLVNFGIIALALWFLAWKPLVNVLEGRRERIAKGLEDAHAAEQARANAERDAQKYIDEQRAQAQRLVNDGQTRGEEAAKTVLEEARRDAEAIRAKARTEAEEERNAILGEVRSQVAQISLAAAERVIGQSLDSQRSQAIIADFFTQVPQGSSSLGQNVEVVSALPLTDTEKAHVAGQLGGRTVTYKVDPSILGGLILRSGERVIDGSVRNNLQGLASQIN